MGKSLVAFDTDHIKEYVFGTDKLKEIRGASSLLDYLNRREMTKLTGELKPETVYANGGSGLFLIDTEKARQFAQRVQAEYQKWTGGKASISYAVQQIPEEANKDIWNYDLHEELDLLQYGLMEAKNSPSRVISLPSHPFMRPCDACGIEYAEHKGTVRDRNPFGNISQEVQMTKSESTSEVSVIEKLNEEDVILEGQAIDKIAEEDADPVEQEMLYCNSCFKKHRQDYLIKGRIRRVLEIANQGREIQPRDGYLWDYIISCLLKEGYSIPEGTDRPSDFNVFRNFSGAARDYLGLIYADGNGMGKKIMDLSTLGQRRHFAEVVDSSIYGATIAAIQEHLKIAPESKLFPFDILLIGGDDIVIVTPASKALQVALTIAKEFHRLTKEKDSNHEGHTLSVGVVLAPTKYPFALLRDLVENTLKFAKKEGAKAQIQAIHKTENKNTLINFMIVTGSTSHHFKKVYDSLYQKREAPDRVTGTIKFYATLRPYNIEQLTFLLNAIRAGNALGLGRTKLHQLREAVLKKNLTTSVSDGLAVLRNWTNEQREYVVQQVYKFGGLYQMHFHDLQNPATIFPRVSFPWFADGTDTYRTSLLDFIELYDFVSREEDTSDDEG